MSAEDRARFRAVYCGLCHTLSVRCGAAARLALRYDLVFLAILLWDEEGERETFRCGMKGFRAYERFRSNTALETAADLTVLLTDWKLRDAITDGQFTPVSYVGRRFLASSYAASARRHSGFEAVLREKMSSLALLERACTASMDEAADAFASLLCAAAEEAEGEERRVILRQLLYHLGRWIYLIDALDDLAEDAVRGRYNPLIYRFGAADGVLKESDKRRLAATLDHSVNLIASAYALYDYGPWRGILDNIIYCSLPCTGRMVMDGTFRKTGKDRSAGV